MRVLIITQHWYPDTFGGSEHVASEQARRLAARGHEITVLTERVRDALPAESRENGAQIIRYGSEKEFARFGGASRTDVREVPKVLRVFARDALASPKNDNKLLDVAILHHPYSAYGFVKARLRVPALYLFHTSTSREAEIEGIRRRLPTILEPLRPALKSVFIARTGQVERRVLNAVDQIAVLSDFSRLILESAFPLAKKKIVKLPIGIDLNQFQPTADRAKIRTRLGLSAAAKIIITVRRFTPRMGLLELVSAMEQVMKELPDAQLLIVGEGPLRGELEKAIAAKKLQRRVLLVGAVPVADLPLYYQAADLFVLPTAAFEGLGMATLEALACGLPVVGTPAGATLEVLGGLDPTLVTKGTSTADIAQGLREFFVLPKEERDNLRVRARKLAQEQYNWNPAISALEQILSALCASSK